MREMTITQALIELKLLDSRIRDEIKRSTFVACGKKDQNVETTSTGALKKDVENDIKSSFQSVAQLIQNRKDIKSAIIAKNATTMVTIGDSEMTVAEAIEYKNSIEYDKILLREMKRQYSEMTNLVEVNNLRAENEVKSYLATYFASEKNNLSVDKINECTDPIRRKNEYSLIDPKNIKNKITDLEDSINDFLANVDVALSVSNAITIIEV